MAQEKNSLINPSQNGELLNSATSEEESRILARVLARVLSDQGNNKKSEKSSNTLIVEDRKRTLKGVEVRSKSLMVGKEKFDVDAPTLMAMIRNVTQTIGEYKGAGNAYAKYVVPGLRRTRQQIAADLQKYFNIKWELNEQGESVFFQ